jgi:hypothetical protein
MILRLALAALAAAAASSVAAKECKPSADAPPGVRAPAPRGCAAASPVRPFAEEAVRAGREPGFVDLGNGSSLRVSGRVRVDVGAGGKR